MSNPLARDMCALLASQQIKSAVWEWNIRDSLGRRKYVNASGLVSIALENVCGPLSIKSPEFSGTFSLQVYVREELFKVLSHPNLRGEETKDSYANACTAFSLLWCARQGLIVRKASGAKPDLFERKIPLSDTVGYESSLAMLCATWLDLMLHTDRTACKLATTEMWQQETERALLTLERSEAWEESFRRITL